MISEVKIMNLNCGIEKGKIFIWYVLYELEKL